MSWIADPGIAWRIVLTAELAAPLDPAATRAALARLYDAQGWAGRGTVLVGDDLAVLRETLGELREGVVDLGLAGAGIVVSGHHSAVDGLGLLRVLAAMTGTTVTSSARGVGVRPDQSGPAGTVVRRLAEVVVTPPARVVTPARVTRVGHDVYVERVVAGRWRTADLVHAAAAGVLAHNGGPTRHLAVAIGVSRAGPVPADVIEDRSALLRLHDVERLSRGEISARLRTTPTQHAVQHLPGGAGRVGGRLMAAGLRLLAPRLGSTLLVSHLGAVTAPDVERLAFYPVTAGGSGLSLGAVSLRAHTVLTLRARGRSWSTDGLEQLLEAVVEGRSVRR